jgi:2-amino-4-hydroxy-6-hydroxymethyldihydropteridine diphosphokinase
VTTTTYVIALGSNRCGRHGSPEREILAALALLEPLTVSPILRTPPLGPSIRRFANAAAIIATPLDPPALLRLLKKVERDFGRRTGRRWGPRVLDLDIALWSGGTWPPFPATSAPGRLSVPHRALAARAFVLMPLVAIAPGWRDPRTGRTVRQLLALLIRSRPVDRTRRRQ